MDNKLSINKIMTAVVLLIAPFSAHAYIGPGIGVGTIGVVLAFLGAIFLGLFAVLYYPIKRWIRRRKRRLPDEADNVNDDKHDKASREDV